MGSAAEYTIIAVLVLLVGAACAIVLGLTHLLGPKRVGAVKQSPYESGVEPLGDARRRFHVRFYLVAVLFLIFDVEIVFLYPWAVLFPRLRSVEAADRSWAAALAETGYTPAFFAVGIGIFFALLAVGFVYEWRKGIFRWD